MTGTERTRRWRARKARGIVTTVNVEITERHVRALMASNMLEAARANDEIKVTKENLTKSVQELVDRWVSGS